MFFTNRRTPNEDYGSLPEITDEASMLTVFNSSYENLKSSGQLLSELHNLDSVYTDQIKKVKEIAGVELINPAWQLGGPASLEPDELNRFRSDFRSYRDEGGPQTEYGYFLDTWKHQRFRQRLEEIADKYPDRRQEILPEIEFQSAALRRAGQMEKADQDTWARSSQGAAAWTAWLAGQAGATFTDITNYTPLGWSNLAGRGAKGLAMAFLKAGATNAAIEAAQQPFIQSYRHDAGLESGVLMGAESVAGAFLFGGALDTTLRGTARGLRSAGAPVPVVRDGQIVGWEAAP